MIYDFYDGWSHGTWWMILWVKTNWTSNFIFGKNLQSWHGHGTFVKWSLQWYILMRLLGLEASSEACTASAANMFRCHGAMHVNNECFIIHINHMTCQQNMFLSQFTHSHYGLSIFRPTCCFPAMDHLAVPDQSLLLPCIFRHVLDTQSEIHRVQVLEDHLCHLETFLKNSEMGHAAGHVRDVRYHLNVVKYYLRLDLIISMIQSCRQVHNYVRRFRRLPIPDYNFIFGDGEPGGQWELRDLHFISPVTTVFQISHVFPISCRLWPTQCQEETMLRIDPISSGKKASCQFSTSAVRCAHGPLEWTTISTATTHEAVIWYANWQIFILISGRLCSSSNVLEMWTSGTSVFQRLNDARNIVLQDPRVADQACPIFSDTWRCAQALHPQNHR